MKIRIKKSKIEHPTSYYPEFTLDTKQLPAIKDWEVGKKYTLEVQTEMTGLNKSQYDAEKMLKASFKIVSVKEDEEDNGNDKKY